MKKLFTVFAICIFMAVLTGQQAMAATIIVNPMFHAEDDNGDPLSGGCLYSYDCGTTTKQAMCADISCSSNADNPTQLDSSGNAELYGADCYKLALYTAETDGTCDALTADLTDATVIWTRDNVRGFGGTGLVSINETYACDLAAALTAISTTETTLLIDCTVAVTNGTTIPANIELRPVQGGTLFVDTGYTLTVNGQISAGAFQIFSGTGTVTNNADGIVYGKWTSGGDNSAAIDNLIANTDFTLVATTIDEFSTDDEMVGRSDTAVPTEQATRDYIARFLKGAYSDDLVITNNSGTPASQLDVDASMIALEDASGHLFPAEDVDLTVAVTASGANGLDSGSEAASTWYYVFVIHNPTTTTTAGLLSLSATAPTMPSGYTYKRRVGSIRNDAGGAFFTIRQEGNRVDFLVINNSEALVLSAGAATSYTDVDCSAAIPATSRHGVFTFTASAGANIALRLQANGYAQEVVHQVAYVTSTNSVYSTGVRMPLDASQVFEYRWSAATGSANISAIGYTDRI